MRVIVIASADLLHVEPYLRHMVKVGWDVHWFQTSPGRVSVEGVTVHRLHGDREYRQTAAKMGYFRQGLSCRRLVRQLAPDVIHAHYASSAGLVAYLSGYRPYAVTIHGSDLIDRSKTWIGRVVLGRVLRGAALVNPVAAHMKPVLDRLGVLPDRIQVLPFGIDLEKFPYRPRGDLFRDGIRVVCNRSLSSAVYDVPTVLRGVAEACRQGDDVRLSLPATGTLVPQLKQLAAELGIADRVGFGSGYSNTEVPAMLAGHDVYVSASHWDGASISLMETMACGTFPVVSDIPANREWLEDGKTALLFPPGDWRRLAEILVGLPHQRELIAKAAQANRDTIERRGDRQQNMAALMKFLEVAVRTAQA